MTKKDNKRMMGILLVVGVLLLIGGLGIARFTGMATKGVTTEILDENSIKQTDLDCGSDRACSRVCFSKGYEDQTFNVNTRPSIEIVDGFMNDIGVSCAVGSDTGTNYGVLTEIVQHEGVDYVCPVMGCHLSWYTDYRTGNILMSVRDTTETCDLGFCSGGTSLCDGNPDEVSFAKGLKSPC